MSGRETRTSLGACRVERRENVDGESRTVIYGHTAVFDIWAGPFEEHGFRWRERIRRGAFAAAIEEAQDVRALYNHDANYILGRTGNGTVTLRENDVGLYYECVAPDTQTIRDCVLAPIQRGDVTGNSFAFTVRDEGADWIWNRDDEIYERTLTALNLYDVGPVVYPAYEATDVALRSLRAWMERGGRPAPSAEPTPRIAPTLRLTARRWLDDRSTARVRAFDRTGISTT